MRAPDRIFRFAVTRVEITRVHQEATVEVTAPDAQTAAEYASTYARGHVWENVKLLGDWSETIRDSEFDRTDCRRLPDPKDA